MLTDKRILDKLEVMEKQYEILRFEKVAEVTMEMTQTRRHLRREPAAAKWRKALPGMRWGGSRITAWFRGNVRLRRICNGRKVFLRARTGAPETLLLIDGEHRGVFTSNRPVVPSTGIWNVNHTEVLITSRGLAGRKHHIALEAYSGHDGSNQGAFDSPDGLAVPKNCRTFRGVEVVLEREDVSDFVFDMRVLRQLAACLDENSLRRGKIIACLAQVHTIIDAMPSETTEERWRLRLAQAREVMKPLLTARNGSTAPYFGLIGHSHIDTAWLWPVTETKRKCARTFSSAINLMERYPEFLFLQTAPFHAEMMKLEYPDIFRRMKRMCADGRWEPNGAMWVEADCNITSGESLVRQILVGAKATREMFGFTGNVLWMPDTFGFSAALPQILQGCGVRYFCTQKMSFNDTTRFPYDTFRWEGIDGTSVIAHFPIADCRPDPATLTSAWNSVQHKDVDDRRLCAFGSGDGGGGPQSEMLEIARRVGDLEGCPRTSYTKLSDFMDRLSRELGDNLPAWSGELYLQYHRGTLTSVAKIKRGNRRSEIALREAEFLCTLGCLCGTRRAGKKASGGYPAGKFLELWKLLLTNQFHDILPGSAIAEANDQAIADFEHIQSEARKLTEHGARALIGRGGGTGRTLLVANSLSWDRRGEIVLHGAPSRCVPVSAKRENQGITVQPFKDVVGNSALAVTGLTVPALGAVTVNFTHASSKPSKNAPFAVTKNKVETPFATIKFDKNGRIVSFVDKTGGRRIVRPGGALNRFLIGQDVPVAYDNWDIDREQRLKMRQDNRLVRREVVAEGPLQLRIRSNYKIGDNSTITQDMVFHSTTPRVDFQTVIDWSEKHKLLKASFELDVRSEFARCEIQYGHIRRPTHANLPQDRAMFEVCCHKWADISDDGFGVALLNDCKYGISVEGCDLGLSLMKSGTHPDARGDAGRHVVTYSLLPHGPFNVQSVVREAYELNVPASVFPAGTYGQDVPSLLTIDAPNVIVESVKWAEDGEGFVIRLYEAGNMACRTQARFNVPVRSVSQTDLLEENPEDIKLEGGAVNLSFRTFEIKTLRCRVR